MDDLSFQYQTESYLCFHISFSFFGHTMDEAGVVFTKLKRAAQHNAENNFVEKLRSLSKKRLSRKKVKRYLLRDEQKNSSTQPLRSSFFDA